MASTEEIWFNLSHEPLKPLVDPYIAIGDMVTTTELYNANTYQKISTPVGQTRILSAIGLDAGNRLLNYITETPEYRNIDRVVDKNELDLGDDRIIAAIRGFVPDVISQKECDDLLNIAWVSANEPMLAISDAVNWGGG
jgi:hypothetical protein